MEQGRTRPASSGIGPRPSAESPWVRERRRPRRRVSPTSRTAVVIARRRMSRASAAMASAGGWSSSSAIRAAASSSVTSGESPASSASTVARSISVPSTTASTPTLSIVSASRTSYPRRSSSGVRSPASGNSPRIMHGAGCPGYKSVCSAANGPTTRISVRSGLGPAVRPLVGVPVPVADAALSGRDDHHYRRRDVELDARCPRPLRFTVVVDVQPDCAPSRAYVRSLPGSLGLPRSARIPKRGVLAPDRHVPDVSRRVPGRNRRCERQPLTEFCRKTR